jgi:uncharacterized membrane protein
MRIALFIHILAGAVGLLSGYVALYSKKGAATHRRSGMVFVYSMVTMALTGALVAALLRIEISVIASLATAYLVVTALMAVRKPTPQLRRLEVGALLLGLVVGVAGVGLGIATIGLPGGERDGNSAGSFFIVSIPALAGSLGDLRMMRMSTVTGVFRLRRHLWRMTYALFIAAASFFLGQADNFPRALQIPPLLGLPVLATLVTMVYWLVRLRRRRRGGRPGAASPGRPVPVA